MSIFITGDTHIPIDVYKLTSKMWPESKHLTKNDYLIICGDFGLIWKNQILKDEIWWTKWLNYRPWTTLFIDGNHENFPRLYEFKTAKMFGGNVGIISDSIYHLKRGEIYTIENKTFWCMGGALSIDKHLRIAYVSWWKEEEPSYNEMNYGLANLEKVNNKIDYIITHTLPISIIAKLGIPYKQDSTSKYLEIVYNTITFNKWYCGHFHEDKDLNNIQILYQNIVKII